MKKQIKVSLTISAVLVAMAGIAQAAPAELNIFGASAQYTYWNAQAQGYAQTKLGCTATAPVNNGGKHGFVSATNCTSTLVPVNPATTKRDLDIRYSGIASAEGVLAIKKVAPLDATLATGCNIANGERLMYASTSTTVCKQVHIGTSDVAGESLTQVSSGQKLGPMGGGAFSATMTAIDTTSLTPNNTVIVPFGFFVNKAVTASTCTGTTGLVGNYCTTAAHCKGNDGVAGTCGAPATISNITREEASLIFSGYVGDWSDLGAYYTAQPVVACLRHAGSGTHSALDLTVMNSLWGANTATAEAAGSIWFNQGSGDEIKCINGNSTATPTGSLIGAIGYADSDQATNVAATSQNVVPVKYNGQYGTRSAIRNGQYDFYTNAWLYTNPANTGAAVLPVSYAVNALANDLVAYAQDPANVPAAKANYWAATGEMKFNRAADNVYPLFTGASTPMLP
jgi:ABC-type phosphate transport system substrate-binding protein